MYLWDRETPSYIRPIQDCCGYMGILYSYINSRAGFLFLWRVVLKFDGDCTDSVNSFGNVTVFTLSVPPIFQGGSSPVLPRHLHFCSLVVWCFLCSGNFTSVLGLADYFIDFWGRREWDCFFNFVFSTLKVKLLTIFYVDFLSDHFIESINQV